MRRYTDLTKKELAELSQEELDRFIELELAYAGITPVMCPVKPVIKEIALDASEVAYEVFGVLFKNQEDALVVSQMEVLREDYDYYGAGYAYKYLKLNDNNAVKTEKYYKKEEVLAVKDVLKGNRLLEEEYDKQKKSYDAFLKDTEAIRDSVREAVTAAHTFFQRVAAMKLQYQRYLTLAEGDEKIARNFFDSAYGILEEEYETAVFSSKAEAKSED